MFRFKTCSDITEIGSSHLISVSYLKSYSLKTNGLQDTVFYITSLEISVLILRSGQSTISSFKPVQLRVRVKGVDSLYSLLIYYILLRLDGLYNVIRESMMEFIHLSLCLRESLTKYKRRYTKSC